MTDPANDPVGNDHLNDIEYLELDDHTTLKAWLRLSHHSGDLAPQPPGITMLIQADATQILIFAHDPITRKPVASINIEFNDRQLIAAIFNVADEASGTASIIGQLLSITDGKVSP